MTRTPPGRLTSIVALTMAGIGVSTVAVSMQRGLDLSDRILHPVDVLTGPPAATEAGFAPALCAGNMPPAELLALADWPLDPNGETCTPHRIARDHEAVEVVERSWRAVGPATNLAVEEVAEPPPVVTLAEVVDRVWRSAREIAASFAARDSMASADEAASAVGSQSGDAVAAAKTALVTDSSAGAPRDALVDVLAERIQAGADDVAALMAMRSGAGAHTGHFLPGGRPAQWPLAGNRSTGESTLLAGAPVVADDVMDTVRGGFETPTGLKLSFGIERLVYINGELSSTTRLNVSDLGTLVGGAASAASLPAIGSTVAVIQNGPNNTFVANSLAPGSLATVIQNSLDNQQIQTFTTISATVNSMEMMRMNRLGEALRGAATGALIR